MEIRPISDSELGLWSSFVKGCRGSVFYQRPEFCHVFSWRASEVSALGFWSKGKLVALLPGGVVEGPEGEPVFRAPFSAGFGAFCFESRPSFSILAEVVAGLNDYCLGRGWSAVELTPAPSIYDPEPDDSLEFALLAGGYRSAGGDLTAHLDVETGFSSQLRQNARRAERSGAVFQTDLGLETAYTFISDQKEKAGMPFSVGRDDMLSLATVFPGGVVSYGVEFEGRLVAAIVVHRLNGRCSLGFSWAHDVDYSRYRVTDYLLAMTAVSEFDRGGSVFDLGTVSIDGRLVEGVARFKGKLGARHTLRRRFVKEFG